MAVGVSTNVILNYYWAYLIVFQVYRIVTRGAGKVDTEYNPAHNPDAKNIELRQQNDQILDPNSKKSHL